MAGKGLRGTKSLANLKEAFAGESQANRRYLYFARVADIEGFPDMAGLFKDTADAQTGHPLCHLDFLKDRGGPARPGWLRRGGWRRRVRDWGAPDSTGLAGSPRPPCHSRHVVSQHHGISRSEVTGVLGPVGGRQGAAARLRHL